MSDNAGQVVRHAAYDGVRVSERVHAGRPLLPRHEHDSLQLCAVLEGEFVEEFGATAIDCAAASVVLRPPQALHQDTFRSAAVRTLLVEFARGPRFDALFAAARLPMTLPGPEYTAAARELTRELRNTDIASGTALEGAVLQLAARLIRAAGQPAGGWIARARRRIDEMLPRRVDADALAAELHVSRSYLFETFRHTEGKTIGEYVVERRLERARALLSDSSVPLGEIAAVCGFADQSHFTRTFRGESGETPGQFRRRMMSASVATPRRMAAGSVEP